MKVAHITPSFYPAHFYGGPTQSVYQLCRHLATERFDVRVLTTNANGPSVLDVETAAEMRLSEGFSVVYAKRLFRESVSLQLLRKLAAYVGWADLVHLTGVYSFPTIPALYIARHFKKPVVWSPRGSLQRWVGTTRVGLKLAWEQVCQAVAPRNVALHVTSEAEAESSAGRMPGMKAHVIPNGTEMPLLAGVHRRDGVLKLLYLGRMHPIKAPDRLLAACAQLRTPEWRLTMAGWGESEYIEGLKRQSAELGIDARVRILEAVIGDTKRDLIESSDIVVAPSHSENFGLTVLEALAHGVPVIASTGTPWKQIEERGCGLWVDNDPAALAEAIDRMRTMPLRDMGRRGREWAASEYSWSSVARNMGRLYREVAGDRA